MHRAFSETLAHKTVKQALLIGTDCPLLTGAHLKSSLEALESSRIILIGANDGGYVLIGGRMVPPCFEKIDWGTSEVLNQTKQSLQRHGINYAIREFLDDLDTQKDLQNLPDALRKRLLAQH